MVSASRCRSPRIRKPILINASNALASLSKPAASPMVRQLHPERLHLERFPILHALSRPHSHRQRRDTDGMRRLRVQQSHRRRRPRRAPRIHILRPSSLRPPQRREPAHDADGNLHHRRRRPSPLRTARRRARRRKILSTSHRDRFRASPSPRVARAVVARVPDRARASRIARIARSTPRPRIARRRRRGGVRPSPSRHFSSRASRYASIATTRSRGNARARRGAETKTTRRVSRLDARGGDARGTEDGFVIVIDVTR